VRVDLELWIILKQVYNEFQLFKSITLTPLHMIDKLMHDKAFDFSLYSGPPTLYRVASVIHNHQNISENVCYTEDVGNILQYITSKYSSVPYHNQRNIQIPANYSFLEDAHNHSTIDNSALEDFLNDGISTSPHQHNQSDMDSSTERSNQQLALNASKLEMIALLERSTQDVMQTMTSVADDDMPSRKKKQTPAPRKHRSDEVQQRRILSSREAANTVDSSRLEMIALLERSTQDVMQTMTSVADDDMPSRKKKQTPAPRKHRSDEVQQRRILSSREAANTVDSSRLEMIALLERSTQDVMQTMMSVADDDMPSQLKT
jgi:uncharacterized protein YbcI